MTSRLLRSLWHSAGALVLSSLFVPAACAQGHGQGPVDKGPIHIDDLQLGTHWFGPELSTKQLKGKVVLVELWGS